jgi:amicoumacin kinase
MEKTVDTLLTKELLFQLFERFSVQTETYKKLGDFENYVYEVFQNGQPVILRLTHSSHRIKEEIQSELDWMNFLHQHQVNVPLAYESTNQKLVESIEASDGSYFYACVFTKAQGEPVKINSPKFSEDLFYAWGKEIGKMHRVTKNYQPSERIVRRANWDEEDLLVNIEEYIPCGDTVIVEKTKELIRKIQTFPKNNDNFGLIHTDMHSGNFFFDDQEIHVFDFDDSCYLWFASDIAIPLYYSILYGFGDKSKMEKMEFTLGFITAFTKGYESENALPEQWKEHLPYFLRLRDITLYSVLHKKIAPEDRNEKILAWIDEMGTRIKNDIAIIDLY